MLFSSRGETSILGRPCLLAGGMTVISEKEGSQPSVGDTSIKGVGLALILILRPCFGPEAVDGMQKESRCCSPEAL